MAATPNINSFAQVPVQGQLDLTAVGGNVFSGRVSSNIGNGVVLVAGQAVKGDTAAPTTAQDGVPPLLPLASNADDCIGFVKFNIKDINYPVNSRLEFCMADTFMYMTADATVVGINRFAPVEVNISTNTVLAWQGVNPIAGFAWDAAISAGDLIRVKISNPQLSASNTSQAVKTATVVATLAQINAGLILIPGVTGKQLTVTNYTARVLGAFTTGTSVELESTNASPVAVSTIAEAALTNGAVLLPSSANTTLGAGFAIALGANDGLKLVNNGTAQAGGTSITFTIQYTQA